MQPVVVVSFSKTARNFPGVLLALFVLTALAAGCVHIPPGHPGDFQGSVSGIAKGYPLTLGVKSVAIEAGTDYFWPASSPISVAMYVSYYQPMASEIKESLLRNLQDSGLFKEVQSYREGVSVDAILDMKVVISELPGDDISNAAGAVSGILGLATLSILPAVGGTTVAVEVSADIYSSLSGEKKTYTASGKEKTFWWVWLLQAGHTGNLAQLLSSATSRALTDIHKQIAADTIFLTRLAQEKQKKDQPPAPRKEEVKVQGKEEITVPKKEPIVAAKPPTPLEEKETLPQREAKYPFLERGKEDYRKARFDQAITHLKEAIASLRNGPSLPQRDLFLRDAYVFLGAAHTAMDQLPLARESFRKALELAPEMSLDPSISSSPKITQLFEEIRNEVRRGSRR